MLAIILWALIAGTILGFLGRALLPGRQNIPVWATILAGIAAAFLGGLVASWFGWDRTPGVDWLKHFLQVIFAVVAVWLVARMMAGRRAGAAGGPTRSAR